MGERPVARACRDIIDRAGDVVGLLATAPPDYLARIQVAAPELATALQPLADAVFTLDYQVANLVGPPGR